MPRNSERKQIQLVIIGLIAALMGIGQNGLLVSLPFLVEHSAFSLPTWSIVIAIGSFLFLPAAPFWGRYSDKNGPKSVVIQALGGMSISFLLLFLFTALSDTYSESAFYWLIGLIIARVIYGCTVAGMVPASQHWAILLCGEENRLKAITSVSLGLSTGRLVGPILSIVLLKLDPFAPLTIMVLFPAIALVAAIWLPNPRNETKKSSSTKKSAPWLPSQPLLPYLMTGLMLCTVIALLQYSFSPLIGSITEWSTNKISDAIGILLTISAAMTLITQVMVIKKKKLDISSMYRLGALCLLTGFILFLSAEMWVFAIAMAISASGAALLVPAYTSKATQTDADNPGAVAGYISMSHTLGYGLASLLAFTATLSPIYPVWICITLSACVVSIALFQLKNTSPKEASQS